MPADDASVHPDTLNAGSEIEPLNVLSLFAGIGGFDLGLERTGGFKTAAFCEISPKCRHLLNHHWPEVPCYDDVCTLTADQLAADGISVDVICGGFPCQDLSFAGKGAGLAGERSGLWREYARLIRELRPAVVIVENVAALLNRGLGVVLGDLADLGYDAEWDRIRAFDVGAPHLRARLWIVAYARGVEHQGFGDAFRRSLATELLEAALANTSDVGYRPDDGSAEDSGSAREDQGQGDQWQRLWAIAGGSCETLADPNPDRQPQPEGREPHVGRRSSNGGLQGVHEFCDRYSVCHEPNACDGNDCWLLRNPDRAPVDAPEPLESSSCFGWRGVVEPIAGGAALHGSANPTDDPGFPHGGGWWSAEPDVGRVAHGVPARVDRLHGLGNAVVPEIPYRLGRAILQARAAA